METRKVKMFGVSGKGNGQFRDPAGLDTDFDGNIIINDAGNHRLQVFDKTLKFVGLVKISNTQLHRPSGLVLDKNENCLYVLNLRAGTMDKLVLKKA